MELKALPEELEEATAPFVDLIWDIRDAIKRCILTFGISSEYSWFVQNVPGPKTRDGPIFWSEGVDFDPDTAYVLDEDNANWFSALLFNLCGLLDKLLTPSDFELTAVKHSKDRAMNSLEGPDLDFEVGKKKSSDYWVPFYGPLGRGFTSIGASAGFIDGFKSDPNNEEQRRLVDEIFLPFNPSWLKLRTVSRRFNKALKVWVERSESEWCFDVGSEEYERWEVYLVEHPREANPRMEMHKIEQRRVLLFGLAIEARERWRMKQDSEAIANSYAETYKFPDLPELMPDDGS